MSEGKRYAKVGDLVIHKRSGEMGRVTEVHPPNTIDFGSGKVWCPVVVMDSDTSFLDVPGKTLFDFLPEVASTFRLAVQGRVDATFAQILADAETVGISERDALLIVGSVIRERMRKEK